MLSATGIVVKYGAATALDGVSIDINHAEMVALVGPNGAGKSTFANAMVGQVAIEQGSIEVDGSIALVPEGRQLFPDLTVDDNLRLGAWRLKNRDTSMVYELFPDLNQFRTQIAGRLSGGQQQMVSIGRALMARPDVLVIDELSLGLAPKVVMYLAEHLTRLNQENQTTVLLIEQEIGLAFGICERAYLIESGRIALSGKTKDLASNKHVREIYLGGLDASTNAIAQVMESTSNE